MAGKNRYYRRSKISEAKFRQVVRLFAMDVTATDTAELSGLSLRSTNTIYQRILVRMAQACAAQSPYEGELQADKSTWAPIAFVASAGVEQEAKRSSLVCSSAVTASTPRSSQTPPMPRCKPSSAARSTPTALSTPMAGGVITAWWISGLIGISGSIMEQ
jgi:hypothetical protein